MSIEQIRNQVLTDRDDLQDLTVHSKNSHGIEEHHAAQQNQPRTLKTFDDFLHQFSADENFTYCKINHAFWEGLSKVYHNLGRDFSKALYRDADKIYGRNNFFSSGFAFDLIDELRRVSPLTKPGLYLGMELSAWSGDQNYMHTPEEPELSVPLFNEFRNMLAHVSSGLILKDAVIDGRIVEFFECLSEKRVLIVGPTYLENLTEIIGGNQVEFLRVPNAESWSFRQSIEDKISDWISQPGSDPSTVLIQCGTVAPFLALRLHRAFPKTRFVDGGLAFSIASPEDLLKRPWGKYLGVR